MAALTWSVSSHTWSNRVAAVCFLCVMCIVGTLGHAFLIYTLHKTQPYRYQCRMFILNISAVSLICNGVGIPVYLVNIIAGVQYYPDTVCSILGYFNSFLFVALLVNCLTIAAERCLSLSGPLGSSNKTKTKLIVLALWVVPLVLALGGLPFFGFNDNQLHCIYQEHTESTWYSIVLVAVPTTVTLVAICTCYILICRKVTNSRRHLLSFKKQTNTPSPAYNGDKNDHIRRLSTSVPNLRDVRGSMPMLVDLKHATFSQSMSSLRERLAAWSDSHEREVRLTVQLLLNFTLFVVLWLPLTMLYFMEGFVAVSPDLWLCLSVLARAFAAINWAMYGLWSKPVRMTAVNLLSHICICCFRSYAKKRKNRIKSIRLIQEQLRKDLGALPSPKAKGSCSFSRPNSHIHSGSNKPSEVCVRRHSVNGIMPIENIGLVELSSIK